MGQGKEGSERVMEEVGKEEMKEKCNGKLILAVLVLPKWISLCFSSVRAQVLGNKRQQK